jgi:ubiquitin-protein ligase
MQGELPPGVTLIQADDLQEWLCDIRVMDENPLYAGETYRLKFTFSNNYPIEVCGFPPPLAYLSLHLSSPLTLLRSHLK